MFHVTVGAAQVNWRPARVLRIGSGIKNSGGGRRSGDIAEQQYKNSKSLFFSVIIEVFSQQKQNSEGNIFGRD